MATNYLISGSKPKFVYSINGTVFTSLSKAAATMKVHKSTITRWCANPNKPDCFREPVETSTLTRADVDVEAKKANLTPLEYMLKVMNNEGEDPKLRAQMANWAAPYIHPKADNKTGKKEQREERAKQAGKGRFTASQPPQLRSVK
jgi:hypothetical protein